MKREMSRLVKKCDAPMSYDDGGLVVRMTCIHMVSEVCGRVGAIKFKRTEFDTQT